MKNILTIAAIILTLNSYASNEVKHLRSDFNSKNINYIVYKPDFVLKKYPLLVFLHGVGEKPNYEEPAHPNDIEKLKKHGPSKLIASDKWPWSLPFIVVSIQCFKDCKFHQPEIVNEVIRKMIQEYPINQKQIYLTGISMGGNGVMRYLAKYPHTIAAAIPIAGWGAGNWCAFNQTAYWGIHNKGDQIVRVEGTINTYKALNNCDNRMGNTKVTIFPNEGHDAWTRVYEYFGRDNIYEYLLNYSRN